MCHTPEDHNLTLTAMRTSYLMSGYAGVETVPCLGQSQKMTVLNLVTFSVS